MTYSENYDLENAIEETKFFLLQQYNSIETIKNTVRDIMTSAGLIIAFLGLAQVSFDSINLKAPGHKECLFLFSIVLYVVMVIIGVFLLNPIVMYTPMTICKKTFKQLFYNKTPKKILENKLENYILATEKNRDIIRRASNLAVLSGFINAIIIILLIAMIII